MKDCRECLHSTKAYSQYLCRVTETVRPTNSVRDTRSECGPEGKLWEPKYGVGNFPAHAYEDE